jgi:preprotein translocase subunit SecE
MGQITSKFYARILYRKVRKEMKDILWMVNGDALDIIIKRVALLILDDKLKDEDYRTRNYLLSAKEEIKKINTTS